MKFKLTNYGRIRTADITMNGITVIAGPNGSGKSTISRALYTWYTLLCQLDREIPQELANIVSDDIALVMKQNGISPYVATRFVSMFFRNRLPTHYHPIGMRVDDGEWVLRASACARACF